MRDWIMNKGDSEKIYSPKIAYIRAAEDFLSKRGYSVQIAELREAVKQKRPMRILSTEKLSGEQREAVALLVKYRQMPEQEAVKWILDHPEELTASVREA